MTVAKLPAKSGCEICAKAKRFPVRANEIAYSFILGLPVTPTPAVLGECGMIVIAPAFDDDLHGVNSPDRGNFNCNGAHGNGDGMFAIEHADLIAIRRSFMSGGRDRALVELRRRYMALTDSTAPTVLNRILAMPVEQAPFAGSHKPSVMD